MSKAAKFSRIFIKQHKLTRISPEKLVSAATKMGYTVVEFNRIINDQDVATIIDNLNLEEEIQKSRGFTYEGKDFRLIFVNEDLNEEEKILVLAHEIGHIVCGHTASASIVGRDVKEEYEANEFVHYLLKKNLPAKIKNAIKKHSRVFVACVVAVSVIVAAFVGWHIYRKESMYSGEYYATTTGNKYHKKDCIHVKDKKNIKRVTKEEILKEKYEACDHCLPDK